MKLPGLSSRKDWKALCGKMRLQVRGGGGVDSAPLHAGTREQVLTAAGPAAATPAAAASGEALLGGGTEAAAKTASFEHSIFECVSAAAASVR